MMARLWCAFNRENLPITSTLTFEMHRANAETVIFQKFAAPRSRLDDLGVHVAPVLAVPHIVKDNGDAT